MLIFSRANWSYAAADFAYATTAQGQTTNVGLVVVTGAEDRSWLYSAMTRGRAGSGGCAGGGEDERPLERPARHPLRSWHATIYCEGNAPANRSSRLPVRRGASHVTPSPSSPTS